MLYLAYVSSESLPADPTRLDLAVDLGLAALLGDDLSLISPNSSARSHPGRPGRSAFAWLADILGAFSDWRSARVR